MPNNIHTIHAWLKPSEDDPEPIRNIKIWFNTYSSHPKGAIVPLENVRNLLDWWSNLNQAILTLRDSVEDSIYTDKIDGNLIVALSELNEYFNPKGEFNGNGK